MHRPQCTTRHRTVVATTVVLLLFTGSGQKLCISGDGATSIESAVLGCGVGQCGDDHQAPSDQVLTHEGQCTDVMVQALLTVRSGRENAQFVIPTAQLAYEPDMLTPSVAAGQASHLTISPHLRTCTEQSRSLRATVILI